MVNQKPVMKGKLDQDVRKVKIGFLTERRTRLEVKGGRCHLARLTSTGARNTLPIQAGAPRAGATRYFAHASAPLSKSLLSTYYGSRIGRRPTGARVSFREPDFVAAPLSQVWGRFFFAVNQVQLNNLQAQ